MYLCHQIRCDMSKFDIKTDLTWRDIALRVALVLCTVAVIVWFMPRDNKPNFKMEVDKVWLYSDLTATFDFPVYKSDSVVKHEREQVMRDFEPYYTSLITSTAHRWLSSKERPSRILSGRNIRN